MFINFLKNERSYKKTIALSKKRKLLLKNDRSFKKTKGDFNIVDKKDGLIRWTNNRVFDIIYNDIKRGKNMAFRINNRRYTGSKYKILEWINEIIDREN